MSSCVQVCRIYVGSFWNQPLQYTGNRCNPFSQPILIKSFLTFNKNLFSRELFEMEEEDLFNELQALPRFALIRRLNDLIKRAKAVKVRK